VIEIEADLANCADTRIRRNHLPQHCLSILIPFLDKEWMDPQRAVDSRLANQPANSLPLPTAGSRNQDPINTMRTAGRQDLLGTTDNTRIRQVRMDVAITDIGWGSYILHHTKF
jgi:hypothetical protein